MFDALEILRSSGKEADFLFPSLPRPVKGTVGHLEDDMVVIESRVDGTTFQYVTHPDSICIVQRK